MTSLLAFDLDGTLVDSRKDIALSLNYALDKEGFATLPQKQIEDLVGWGARHLVEEAIGNPSAEDLQRVFMTFWNHYDEHLLDHTFLYPDVRNFLEKFPNWHKAVVTNKPQGFSEKIVQGLEIHEHFKWLIGGDALPVQKPDPEVFGPIRKDLGAFSRAVIIGDSVVDIKCGKAAGMITCALTHGFGIREELAAAEPDYLVEGFSELADLPFFRE